MNEAMEDAMLNAEYRARYINVGDAEDLLEQCINLHMDDINSAINGDTDINYVMHLILAEYIINVRHKSVEVDYE